MAKTTIQRPGSLQAAKGVPTRGEEPWEDDGKAILASIDASNLGHATTGVNKSPCGRQPFEG